jgi:5-methylcytosine-specific restriction protein A
MALRTLPQRLKPATIARAPFPKSEGGKNAAHYQSPEHKAWRIAVLSRDGFTCAKCGAHDPGVRLIADHIVEIEDGGAPLDPDNGQTLCGRCSNVKTARARQARLERPASPRGDQMSRPLGPANR